MRSVFGELAGMEQLKKTTWVGMVYSKIMPIICYISRGGSVNIATGYELDSQSTIPDRS
jgi:hypothetical protein